MAAARDTVAEHIKPLEGAIVRRHTAGTTIAAGEIVSLMADGYVDPADTGAFTGAQVVGVAIGAAIVGGRVDVVVFGPIVCLTGATVAATIYATDTAGEPGEAVGTSDVIVGYAESATVLFVRPRLIDLS